VGIEYMGVKGMTYGNSNPEVVEFDGFEFMPALSDSAQHITVYVAATGRPVGTLARRRVMDREGAIWTVYATDGSLLRKVRYVPTSYTALARIVRNAVKGR
jgi:hypothetical protein